MLKRLASICCVVAWLACGDVAAAQDARAAQKAPGAPPAAPRPARPREPADVPAVKGDANDPSNRFLKRHEGFLQDLKAKGGQVGVVFVGDSITDGWRRAGKATFDKTYGGLDPLNLGIGGDRTQHVLWRLENGEVEGIHPKVAVLMIGTNNLGSNTNDEIVAGVTKIVESLRTKLPSTKVLLLGIFPRGAKADDPARGRINAINGRLAGLDDGKTVKYLDIGDKFLAADGSLPKDVMPDALHPNEKGYEIWAEAMAPTLAALMQ